jgi:flagellin-like protein
MTLSRLADHVTHAAAFRAMHGVTPLVAALVLVAIAVVIVLKRR